MNRFVKELASSGAIEKRRARWVRISRRDVLTRIQWAQRGVYLDELTLVDSVPSARRGRGHRSAMSLAGFGRPALRVIGSAVVMGVPHAADCVLKFEPDARGTVQIGIAAHFAGHFHLRAGVNLEIH